MLTIHDDGPTTLNVWVDDFDQGELVRDFVHSFTQAAGARIMGQPGGFWVRVFSDADELAQVKLSLEEAAKDGGPLHFEEA